MIEKIETEQAPKAIGPYSQAVAAGSFLFISGQIPVDPKTGTLVEKTIEKQTTQVFDNLEAILQAKNLNFSHVVKMEVYLKDMQDFAAVNAIYSQRVQSSVLPARQAMQVAKLPLDALIEISCIAHLGC